MLAQRPLRASNSLRRIMAVGDAAFKRGDIQCAREAYLDVLFLDPDNVVARTELKRLELWSGVPGHEISSNVHVRLAMPIDNIMRQRLTVEEAFVLTRLGLDTVSVATVVAMCPFSEVAVLEILQRHLISGNVGYAHAEDTNSQRESRPLCEQGLAHK